MLVNPSYCVHEVESRAYMLYARSIRMCVPQKYVLIFLQDDFTNTEIASPRVGRFAGPSVTAAEVL